MPPTGRIQKNQQNFNQSDSASFWGNKTNCNASSKSKKAIKQPPEPNFPDTHSVFHTRINGGPFVQAKQKHFSREAKPGCRVLHCWYPNLVWRTGEKLASKIFFVIKERALTIDPFYLEQGREQTPFCGPSCLSRRLPEGLIPFKQNYS